MDRHRFVVALIAAAKGAGVVLLLGGLVVAGVISWNHARQQEALRTRARAVWAQLWYCNRDGIICRPETGEALRPSQLHEFVYGEAAGMPAQPSSSPAAPAYPSMF